MNLIKFLKFYDKTDKYIFYGFFTNLICIFLITGLTLLALNYLPKRLPLYYSLPWGDKQLASQLQFFILPILILLIGTVNLFLSWYLHNSQLILKRILAISAGVFAVMILLTGVKIIFIFL